MANVLVELTEVQATILREAAAGQAREWAKRGMTSDCMQVRQSAGAVEQEWVNIEVAVARGQQQQAAQQRVEDKVMSDESKWVDQGARFLSGLREPILFMDEFISVTPGSPAAYATFMLEVLQEFDGGYMSGARVCDVLGLPNVFSVVPLDNTPFATDGYFSYGDEDLCTCIDDLFNTHI